MRMDEIAFNSGAFSKIEPECRFQYLSPSELLKRLEEKAILYFPIGSLEWHNEHLPLGTDTLHSEVLAMRLCSSLGGVVLPPFWWNTGGCHRSSVTYHMQESYYRTVIKTVCLGFREIPAKLLVLINGHGGKYQFESMEFVANELNNETGFPIRVVAADPYLLGTSSPCRIDHANTGETSFSMELIPHLVRMERDIKPDLYSGRMPFEIKGAPSKESGNMLWEAFEKDAVELIEREYGKVG